MVVGGVFVFVYVCECVFVWGMSLCVSSEFLMNLLKPFSIVVCFVFIFSHYLLIHYYFYVFLHSFFCVSVYVSSFAKYRMKWCYYVLTEKSNKQFAYFIPQKFRYNMAGIGCCWFVLLCVALEDFIEEENVWFWCENLKHDSNYKSDKINWEKQKIENWIQRNRHPHCACIQWK